MTNKIDKSQEPNPDWFEWWIDPIESGKPEPNPQELREAQDYIKEKYTPETQAKININVRHTKWMEMDD